MAAPFDSPDFLGWWRHDHHKRSVRLASENILEVAKNRALAKRRRRELWISVKQIAKYAGALALTVFVALAVARVAALAFWR